MVVEKIEYELGIDIKNGTRQGEWIRALMHPRTDFLRKQLPPRVLKVFPDIMVALKGGLDAHLYENVDGVFSEHPEYNSVV